MLGGQKAMSKCNSTYKTLGIIINNSNNISAVV